MIEAAVFPLTTTRSVEPSIDHWMLDVER